MPASRMTPTALTAYPTLCDFVAGERLSGDGCICPVCQAHNRVKRYRLVSGHFAILRRLALDGVSVAVHCRDFAPDGQAYNKMLNVPRHYGFIRQFSENPNNPLNRSGMWAITESGMQFINNRIRVPICFWGIHDAVIWWASDLMNAADMEESVGRSRLRDMIADMTRPEIPNAGQFRVEYHTDFEVI